MNRPYRQNAGMLHQRGAGLISLLVGIVISMLIMLAMMTLYRDTIHTGVSAGQDAASDGQRASGLLAAQILLQAAGFGLTAPALGTDLIVLSNASLDSSMQRMSGTVASAGVEGNAIVWSVGTLAGAGIQCSGLYAPAGGGLQRLLPTPCTGSTQWAAAIWSTSALVTDTRAVSVAAMPTDAAGCQPFGMAVTGGMLVTLKSTRSTVLTAITPAPSIPPGLPVEVTVCLANFAAPTA
ncbi:MAG: hypothetical protein V4636_14040 [Pseudomonadota bacterium]